jgi:hypothetical protein
MIIESLALPELQLYILPPLAINKILSPKQTELPGSAEISAVGKGNVLIDSEAVSEHPFALVTVTL